MVQRARYHSNGIKLVAASEDFYNPHEPAFKLGDIVSLNSGGPRAMIVDLDSVGCVTVSWCNEAGKVMEELFPIPCLYRVSPLAG